MHVVQIINRIQSSAGSSYAVTRLAHWLSARGHDSEVLSVAPAPAQWQGGARLRLDDSRFARTTGLGFGLLRECRRLADQAVVLHNHGVWRLTNLFPLGVGRSARARIVCSPEGTFAPWCMQYKSWRKLPFWSLLQRPALAQAHSFHAASEMEAADIRRLGFRQPIAVVPNGVEIPPVPRAQRRNELLFLGRLAPEKGIDLLLLAWQQLAPTFPQWTLRIAGPLDGAYPKFLQRRARELALARCEFPGEVSGASKAAAFASARLFVLPSHTENFGIAVAEALAHAVPVVTTTGTPWAELAGHGCGWQVPAQVHALTEVLRKALALPSAELEAMGAMGRIWVERDFGWDAVGERMAATYEWLLSSPGAPPPHWVEV